MLDVTNFPATLVRIMFVTVDKKTLFLEDFCMNWVKLPNVRLIGTIEAKEVENIFR